jgi:uncharacterized RDD family membrane protein YckC
MKCPKCAYLGFETGDRCKNCGYDFSLMTRPSAPMSDVMDTQADSPLPSRVWLDDADQRGQPNTAAVPGPSPAGEPKVERALPLFMPPGEDDDDEPLIKLPVAPRPPLSVRKTPESPRVRAMSRPSPRVEVEPVLQFAEEVGPLADLQLREEPAEPARAVPRGQPARMRAVPSGPGARLAAAFIDQAILLAIDATVIYFTLRMALLPASEWRLLPAVPLLAFLGLVTFAYFCAFTAVGGQTIGKMALGIRVVTDDNAPLNGACAFRRTVAGLAALIFGLGFIPALVSAERRAFHDRVAHTRVIAL